MSFREEDPNAWNKAIDRFGYICPECGNSEHFRQYWRVVKDISCDVITGIINYSDTEYSNDLHPQITEVECVECGAQACICKRSVVINVFNHDGLIEVAENIKSK